MYAGSKGNVLFLFEVIFPETPNLKTSIYQQCLNIEDKDSRKISKCGRRGVEDVKWKY